MDNRINALRSFLDASHSMYHAQAYLVKTLKEAGYTGAVGLEYFPELEPMESLKQLLKEVPL